jgi:hypothetical protein
MAYFAEKEPSSFCFTMGIACLPLILRLELTSVVIAGL